jgi:hypothetical protein
MSHGTNLAKGLGCCYAINYISRLGFQTLLGVFLNHGTFYSQIKGLLLLLLF